MNRSFLALALALSVLPTAALAQDTGGRPVLTDQQRQAIHQTFDQYKQQEKQLRQQFRYQVLSSLTASHRRAVAATIGELAVEENPDVQAATRRLDQILSSAERSRIMQAHEAYRTQSHQLHEQMKSDLDRIVPNHPTMNHPENANEHHFQPDAGTILLMALVPHPMMPMMMHGMMMHGEGAPPQQ
jgi:hypothetical protein